MHATPSSGQRILYVDDDKGARDTFAKILRHSDYNVDVAETGTEAIERAHAIRYELVATDLDMPGINGIELIDQLYTAIPTSTFVLVTGVVDLQLPTNTASARAISCVVRKPYEPTDLVATVRRALQLRSRRRTGQMPTVSTESSSRSKILLIEDNPGDARLVRRYLKEVLPPHDVTHVERLTDAIDAIDASKFDVILSDLSLPDARGMDCVARLHTATDTTPIIVLSGLEDENLASQAVHLGAQDYLVKGEASGRNLARSIRYAIERKGTEKRLAHLAHYDQLTGLANRTLFRERLSRAVGRVRRKGGHAAVMLLDLDRFKHVNDTLGHDAGDTLLTHIAERLRLCMRESDTVARLGGDEFAIVLEDELETDSGINIAAQRILAALERPVDIDGHEACVSASIGIALFPDNGDSVEELIKNADSAMYRAKDNGRNNYQLFDREMHGRAMEKLHVEKDLRYALARGEFELHYQPVNRLGRGTQETSSDIVFEALLRWNRQGDNCVMPTTFIPMLESIGQISAVGEWVLHQACRQIRIWQDTYGVGFRVAVNVSPRQFDDPDVVNKVQAALQSAGVNGRCLELEITENLLMRDTDAAPETLRRLKQLGIRISIDDFGTGYSRLMYLANFPLDVLKIDKSIVSSIGARQADSVIRAVIDLGHSLGLEVIAEGVEQVGQRNFLEKESCDFYQGYLRAKPMTVAQCEQWLEEQMS